MPWKCPYCNTELEINERHTRVYCSNLKCSSILEGQIAQMCNVMSIKGLGPETILQLRIAGCMKNLSDIFSINFDEYNIKRSIGKKITENISKELKSKLNKMTLVQLIDSYNFPDIGTKIIEKIVNKLGVENLEQMNNILTVDAIQMDGIGDKIADKFVYAWKIYYEDMLKFESNVSLDTVQSKQTNTGNLTGLSFCFTGKLETLKRSKAEKLVVDNGGTICSVSNKLTYLVTNDTESGSSKNEKAKKLGVKIITEDEFRKIIGL